MTQEILNKITEIRNEILPGLNSAGRIADVLQLIATETNTISQPFSNSPKFTSFPLVMEQKQITAPLTITPFVTGAIPGAIVLMRLVADGVQANTPVFNNAKQITGSSGWDNAVGTVNIINMQVPCEICR